MFDTFDPTGYATPSDCVQALQDLGIKVGHRVAARLLAIGKRNIRFSLAVLEEIQAGGELRELFFSKKWYTIPSKPSLEQIKAITEGFPVEAIPQGDIIHIVTPDEAITLCDNDKALALPLNSLLPQVVGTPSTHLSGFLWERKKLEEASLYLLDSEDESKLISGFRYLFRALVTTGQDPIHLLCTALKRGKPALCQEVAHQVKEHLNYELGYHLAEVFSCEQERTEEALDAILQKISSASIEPGDSLLSRLLYPALTALSNFPQGKDIIFSRLNRLSPLIDLSPDYFQPLLEILLQRVKTHPHDNLSDLADFLIRAASKLPYLKQTLIDRLRSSSKVGPILFYGSVLSRMPLKRDEKIFCAQKLVNLFLTSNLDIAQKEALRYSFLNLGPLPLQLLLTSSNLAHLKDEQRIWIIYLWDRYHEEGIKPPPEDLFIRFAAAEIIKQRRPSILALARTGLINEPLLSQHLRNSIKSHKSLIETLYTQAYQMEDPDNRGVLDLLADFGWEALDSAFNKLREDVALQSAAAATRLLIFSRLAARIAFHTRTSINKIRRYIREILGYPIFVPQSLPSVWQALGHLGTVQNLGPRLQRKIIRILSYEPHIFPNYKLSALLTLHPYASSKHQKLIEQTILNLLTNPPWNRKLIDAALEAVYHFLRRGNALTAPSIFITKLCQIIVTTGSEPSPEQIMLQALNEVDSDNDGILLPCPWDKEHKDLALKILGELACQPHIEDRIHSGLVVRLFSFLEDWLEAIEKGKNLYATRTTPLWTIVTRLLYQRPGRYGRHLAARTGIRILKIHHSYPHRLGLPWRESMQRFMAALIELNISSDPEFTPPDIAVPVTINLPRQLLNTLKSLPPAEEHSRPLNLYILEELTHSHTIDPHLKQEIIDFLDSYNLTYPL